MTTTDLGAVRRARSGRTGVVSAHLASLAPVAGLLDAQLRSVTAQTESAAMALVDSVTTLDVASHTVLTKGRELAGASDRAAADVQQQIDVARQLVRGLVGAAEERDQIVLQLFDQLGSVTEEVSQIGSAMRMLSLNARIEATRAGAAGATFTVVADEVRQMALQSQQRADQLQHDLATLRDEVIGVLRHAREEADARLATTADELASIAGVQKEFADMVQAVVAEVVASAMSVNEIAGVVLTKTQFQDITRQVVEQVCTGLEALGEQLAAAGDCLDGRLAPQDIDTALADELYSRYVMASQRQVHHEVAGSAPAARQDAEEPAIELF